MTSVLMLTGSMLALALTVYVGLLSFRLGADLLDTHRRRQAHEAAKRHAAEVMGFSPFDWDPRHPLTQGLSEAERN